jgi:6-pyruvoyltetrahydropterin/6-carboxytetrahydropterin synthase
MIITCTRRLTFESGHRVHGHESKCANLHGHSYKAEIEASAELDSLGRVIDFSVLKEKVGGWIDFHLDHGFILWVDDLEARGQMLKTKLYLMPYNPTAENLARHLLLEVCPLVLQGTGVTVTRVVIHETENCKAEARL